MRAVLLSCWCAASAASSAIPAFVHGFSPAPRPALRPHRRLHDTLPATSASADSDSGDRTRHAARVRYTEIAKAKRSADRQRKRDQRLKLAASAGGGGPAGGPTAAAEAAASGLVASTKVCVIGGGSFGVAMASVFGRKGIPVQILVRKPDVAQHVNAFRTHPTYLSDIEIPSSVMATASPAEALSGATLLVHAVPTQFTRAYLRKIIRHVPAGVPVLSLSKGIETKSLCLMCDVLRESLGDERGYAFLSGPSFAREIMLELQTAVVIASDDMMLAKDLCDIVSSDSFRALVGRDVIGVEVGGAVKNVIALAAGIAEGLDLGTNAIAALVTRGVAEMSRISLALGGRQSTLAGLSGVGDTFGTCFGPLSRNRSLGVRLGKGEKLKDILASSTQVAEGVDTAFALAELIKKRDRSFRVDLKFPIIFGMCEILKGKIDPFDGMIDLMNTPLRSEAYDFYD